MEDLVLIYCAADAVAVGVYTQNLVYAAPVAVDRQRTPNENFRVLVVNSGNANACTGARGMEDALRMTQLAANSVGVEESQALVMSTGIIGEFLPMEKIANGVLAASQALGSSDQHAAAASRGFLTTDNGPKAISRVVELPQGPVTITGIAKGAGMIGPRMATLLVLLATDARLAASDAQAALQAAVDVSFNRISVDGHTSTNDTALLVSSGAAQEETCQGEALAQWQACLEEVCIELAKMVPNDGEGASHLMEVEVLGAASESDADLVARAVGDSPLVKTAVSGADPNWGRIVSAAGYSGAAFAAEKITLHVNGVLLFEHGEPAEFDAAQVSHAMRDNRETKIRLELGAGDKNCCYWASDLTCDYVTFNADYHT